MTCNTDRILRGTDLPPLKPLYNEPDEQANCCILPPISVGEIVAKLVLGLLTTVSVGIVAAWPNFGSLLSKLFH